MVLEERHGLFKLGTQVGVLDKYFAYNAFFKTKLECSFKKEEIPKVVDKKGNKTDDDVTLSLREAVSKLSIGTGQGYVKCGCTNNAKCSTQRCSCKQAKIACSFKSHGKSPDSNCVNNEDFYKKSAKNVEEEIVEKPKRKTTRKKK